MSRHRQHGQAIPLVVMLAFAILASAGVLLTLGRAYVVKADSQAAADLVAVGAGRLMRFDATRVARIPDGPERLRWRSFLRERADRLARANGARLDVMSFVDDDIWPPTTVRVRVSVPGPFEIQIAASAQATLVPGSAMMSDVTGSSAGGQYAGPIVHRQGKPMCPAVAAAFDDLATAAAGEGVALTIVSAFRTDREQAELFRRHPDPKWVAPPGRSRHRDATELDLDGTGGAWSWLAANAERFGFVQRYSWEPWHYGYRPGCSPGHVPRSDWPTRARGAALPAWVPQRFRASIVAAARSGGVQPVVLAALLRVESGFDPGARSPAGAQGIAQFMPATARGMGLGNPFDPFASIRAAGDLLGRHLRGLGSLTLALAAYNAGPGAVARFGGVPPYPETRAYIAKILALAGDPSLGDPSPAGMDVVLTRIGTLLV